MDFVINGVGWNILFVDGDSNLLRRSDKSFTVGVTDNNTKCVYLSNLLYGAFLRKVLCHELTHCFSFSHNLVIPIDTEEMIADFIATYGEELIYLLDDLMISIKERTA